MIRTLVYSPDFQKLQTLLKPLDLEKTLVLQSNFKNSIQALKENLFEQVMLDIHNLTEIDNKVCSDIFALLKPGGVLVINWSTPFGSDSQLKDRLISAGYKSTKIGPEQLIFSKPEWVGQGTAQLKKKKLNNAESVANTGNG
eukprot:CAMPEP_0114591944 /NCGR_PEP_ID=MMETSP0125-20121206/13890_1 /TAXON_ID=485358 ORGANISM="Aristerostoma sp., Strain ATCC 50986" /NCGR_SAMPLE_ID=MMETSP0125 /ASSEMBLY_ACC=CAM_ASM_000245 /LENGTH=141 /DNA_ID=CAMNT_0001790333 /DNA_START=70 /DNA_END=495 /DNA_ORIENTATION=-